jgi:hypothetical protein
MTYPPPPSVLPEADALALVDAAAARLWTPEGADALAYLHGRGLTDTTIGTARLGVAPPLALPGRPRGVVIPWLLGDRPALVKLRQPAGVKPKYREIFRDPARLVCYPGPHVMQPGRPPARGRRAGRERDRRGQRAGDKWVRNPSTPIPNDNLSTHSSEARKTPGIGDFSTVTGADLRIAGQGQEGSTRDPLHDSELAPTRRLARSRT